MKERLAFSDDLRILQFFNYTNLKLVITMDAPPLLVSSAGREAPLRSLCFFCKVRFLITMKTRGYVDGFNLYYRCLKNSRYKWLDLKKLFQVLLKPDNQITEIHYFTARVSLRPDDALAPQRQKIYLKALEAYTPEIKIHYGHFLQNKTRMCNANPPPNTVEVIKTEEKGSDVNLAVHLLNDAWLDNFECGVVVSNDSDMSESMRLVRKHHPDKILGLINPVQRTSNQLKQYAHFTRTIRNSALKASQLPDPIPRTNLRKPNNW